MAEQSEMQSSQNPGILVVGAGLPRTGTNTLRDALRDLGLPCYHMIDVKERMDFEQWNRAIKMTPEMRNVRGVWQKMLADPGFSACVDFPSDLFWSEIKEYFERNTGKKVLVILTERDSAEQWYASMKKTVIPSFKAAMTLTNRTFQILPGSAELADSIAKDGWFDGKMDDEEHCKQLYTRHNEYVKQSVPERDLLVLNVAQHGYSDLVSFLERHHIAVDRADHYRTQTQFAVTNSASKFIGSAFINHIQTLEKVAIGAGIAAVAGLAVTFGPSLLGSASNSASNSAKGLEIVSTLLKSGVN